MWQAGDRAALVRPIRATRQPWLMGEVLETFSQYLNLHNERVGNEARLGFKACINCDASRREPAIDKPQMVRTEREFEFYMQMILGLWATTRLAFDSVSKRWVMQVHNECRINPSEQEIKMLLSVITTGHEPTPFTFYSCYNYKLHCKTHNTVCFQCIIVAIWQLEETQKLSSQPRTGTIFCH